LGEVKRADKKKSRTLAHDEILIVHSHTDTASGPAEETDRLRNVEERRFSAASGLQTTGLQPLRSLLAGPALEHLDCLVQLVILRALGLSLRLRRGLLPFIVGNHVVRLVGH
jgi:hypothetical protein